MLSVAHVARTYKELSVWQLADALRTEHQRFASTPRFAADFKLRDHSNETMSSICRNVREGFKRRSHGEFARFLEFSQGSVAELESIYEDARVRNHVGERDLVRALDLSDQLTRALGGFIAYLRRTPTPKWHRHGPRKKG